MNKKLIKTYFEEFNHWLNGGKVRAYYKKDDEPSWFTDKECIDCDNNDNFNHILKNSLGPDDVLIVIDDEYVEFRKALAEGKAIQHVSHTTGEWVDFNKGFEPTPSYTFLSTPEYYRIKPNEPKFKVGDWLIEIHSNSYAKVLEVIEKDLLRVKLYDSNAIITTESTDFIHWQPKSGEWCLFSDSKNPSYYMLAKYGTKDHEYSGNYESNYDICEPFIGTLPTFLQEQQ